MLNMFLYMVYHQVQKLSTLNMKTRYASEKKLMKSEGVIGGQLGI
jgi:hypothetical protein